MKNIFNITTLIFIGLILSSNKKSEIDLQEKTLLRLVVFVDNSTKEHLYYKIFEGTTKDWGKTGRKLMNKEAEESGNTIIKDFVPDNKCIMVYSVLEDGKKKYKRASGSKEQVLKQKKEYSKYQKTFSYHEIKCL